MGIVWDNNLKHNIPNNQNQFNQKAIPEQGLLNDQVLKPLASIRGMMMLLQTTNPLNKPYDMRRK